MFLSYTIFADINCTQVRSVANLFGTDAVDMLRRIGRLLGSEPKEGVQYRALAIRIDRIGSEQAPTL